MSYEHSPYPTVSRATAAVPVPHHHPEPALLGPDEPRLTPRQSGAVACLLAGMTTREGAAAMGLSRPQFWRVVGQVRARFQVASTARVIALAARMVADPY